MHIRACETILPQTKQTTYVRKYMRWLNFIAAYVKFQATKQFNMCGVMKYAGLNVHQLYDQRNHLVADIREFGVGFLCAAAPRRQRLAGIALL